MAAWPQATAPLFDSTPTAARTARREDLMAKILIAMVITVLAATQLQAQPAAPAWPTRPVTMIVPFAAGGPVDTTGRIMGARLGELLGQQIVIENVAGAGSGTHVCSVLLDAAMGTKITHVPYRGAGPALQDLFAGRIDFIAEQISTALPQIQAHTVKA